MTRIINLFGGPGIGKSTTASDLFRQMKDAGLRVELVTEYAKELTYEGSASRLDNQLHLLAEQDLRQRRLLGQADWVVTDSPLLLSIAYAKPPFNQPWFTEAVLGLVRGYDNLNFKLGRWRPYLDFGRRETEEQARQMDARITDVLRLCVGERNYTTIPCDRLRPPADFIFERIIQNA